MYALYFMIAIGLFTMFMLYKSVMTDYKRYKQTKSVSIVIGWSLFAFVTIFTICGIWLTINYGRVAPFDI